jgi:HTH-type transcriptional regulator / antitoxin HigA
MSTVTVTSIRTKQDYQNAMRRIDELLGINPEPYSELDVISFLVHTSEQAHHAILYPDPIDAIK